MTVRSLALVALLAVTVAACGEASEHAEDAASGLAVRPPAPPSVGADRADERISPAQAQAEAAMAQVAFGLEPTLLASLKTGRVLAEDFDGAPFVYLVFTSKKAEIAEPLSFVALSDASDGDTTTVVAATPSAPRVSLAARNHTLLRSLVSTLAALGGRAKMKRLVAATPTAFVIEDTAGIYWDVASGARAASDVVAQTRQNVARAKASPEAAAERARLAAAWDDHVANPTRSIASVTKADANLDLAGAALATGLTALAPSIRPTEMTPAEATRKAARLGLVSLDQQCERFWFFGWHKRCEDVERGSIPDPKKQAHMPSQTHAFTIPRCVVGGDLPNVAQGCGPAALTSLVWRAWQSGTRFPALAGFTRGDASAIETDYPAGKNGFASGFESVLGAALSKSMSTCTLDGHQGLTLPSDFHEGGNAWLAAQNAGLHIEHAYSVPPLHRADASRKAKLLHRLVGVEERPVVALGDLQLASSHYSPVVEYRLVDPDGLFPEVWVRLIDHPDLWINLHGTFQLTSGLFWLEKN